MKKQYLYMWIVLAIILFFWAVAVFLYLNKSNNSWTWSLSSNINLLDYYDFEIKELYLKNLKLTQIPDLCKELPENILQQISLLNLSLNQISSANYDFSCMPNLTQLDLSYNKISNLDNLILPKTVLRLSVQKNSLLSIKWIQDYAELMELDISYNKIQDITPVFGLKNLISLTAHNNNIAYIDWLQDMKSLEVLKLEFNQIEDKVQTDKLLALTGLVEFSITYNKLDKEYVQSLQSKLNK